MDIKLEDILDSSPPEELIYKDIDGFKGRLLIKKAALWTDRDCRTAVVWIHGGGWESGTPEMFLPHMNYFAKRGAVSFSIQYRLSGSKYGQHIATVSDCLNDCKSAIRFIRKNAKLFGINTEKIVVGGDSSGGHLAACLGSISGSNFKDEANLASCKVNAVIDCNGIIDMTMKWKEKLTNNEYFKKQAISNDILQSWMQNYEKECELSPIYNITERQPPILIIHGLKDNVVEPEEAVRYYNAIKAVGNRVELVLIPDVDHAFLLFNYKLQNDKVFEILGIIDKFLVREGVL